tara:strand:+ start:97049 stop:98197 length:1149 start_codon:yes stop_codon:yes gene_type:complete
MTSQGPQKIVNVTGFDNGCGAHDFLHVFDDQFEKLPWDFPQYQLLLQLFSETYGVELTAENFRKALDAIPGYANKEYAFGPIIRQHIAEVLHQDADYKELLSNQFFTAAGRYLGHRNNEGTDQSLIRANGAYLAQLQADYTRSGLELDAFMAYKQADIKAYYNKDGFNHYIEALGETSQGLMLTVDEISVYARIMGINLNVYGRNNAVILQDNNYTNPLFDLTLHNSGIHWRYQADYLSSVEVAARNRDTCISPLDRHPIIQNINQHGWNPDTCAPLIQRVQDACLDMTLADDFLSHSAIPHAGLFEASKPLLMLQSNIQERYSGQAQLFHKANDFLNEQLDQGVEFSANEFEARFDALEDAVSNGSMDEIDLLTRASIKLK